MAKETNGGIDPNHLSDLPGADDRTIIKADDEVDELTPSKPKYKPPYLVLVDGPRAGAHFPLSEEADNVIGRAPGNAVRLDDQSVSRQHSSVSKTPSGWMLKDLGSKNGTYVNGRPVTDSVVMGHKDVVKVGIYVLRLITQETSLEEEMTLPQEFISSDRTVFVSTTPDGQTAEMGKEEADKLLAPTQEELEGEKEIGEVVAEEEPKKKRFGKREMIFAGALGLVVIVAVAYFASRSLFKKAKVPQKNLAQVEETQQKPAVPEIPQGPEAASIPAAQPGTVGPTPEGGMAPSGAVGAPGQMPVPQALPGTPAQPQGVPPSPGALSQTAPQAVPVQTAPVFLDFASSPTTASVKFKGETIGKTPLRVNVELEPDKPFQAEALFEMPELKESYTETVDFTAEKGATVIPIHFRAPIGVIKVNELPRDVEFYLEGKYSYDKFSERSAKLNEIVLQKPIYIPYGDYFVELRRTRQLSQTSQTFVSDIIFKRDFKIAEESPSFNLEVKEDDLKIFPVKIKTEPPNADVFIDGKKVGVSPYEGNFPLGEHQLAIQKEGYFEHSEALKVDINMPFVANIKLQTSIAGAHLNNAKLAMDRQMYQEAINELAEALATNPAPIEVARANYMLGTCYLKLNDIQRAMGYFEQAKANEEMKYAAMLGLASGYAMLQQTDKALPLLVEVMLKNKDENVKRESNALFQKVSPFRSVLYVYSDPPGADVVVNDKPIAQKTPVILHEMPLGNYRLHVEKPGFIPTDLSLSLSVNEFNPVIVKLKPIPQ